MAISYKQLLPKITTFIFDVDGVLTNGMLTIMPDGELLRHMNVKDGYAMKKALNSGFRICIISGGTNEGVRKRLELLGIEDIYLGAHDKIKQYQELVAKYDLKPENVLYMGDDIPDIPVLKVVGMACAPNDAAPEIQQIALYISNKKGGEGCVRDVIEQTLRVQNKWNDFYDGAI
ncbi:MAG: HAD-IIIA family hydrolase [Flavobacteriia bacterium]|nr:HAD-IIIA family hydrolase [Flavobacteriia bacterium]OIP45058.1 MAG: 3-deoxy-D-manno-octulosonate 8-phosphate phosphatase [Flavobacteriaceae bacterium CG2_30_31_66]PIV95251.1 MAG: 3-deoxy-D-manno-octulosonate 8-phosphate phosphatase [Flavobacteriaceae bacterium CG17_big_fil_post_rev_8_21_14_2_50_31_13]PIX11648.1 MAG: 3-deoxy-D-manno-octulosonate 8-phosphate phosphatase [Flavobacteriaceae bacterium CG_4_8_14_3_um_filter_31_8]PIY13582.1 MAG: 3-deoxy-D-manno-octulosonate 8-phosphate phosphatase 